MKRIVHIIQVLILLVNILFIIAFIFTAYSPSFHPEKHPILSSAGLAFPLFLLINISFMLFWLFIKIKYALLPLLSFFICFSQIKTYFPIHFKSQDPPEQHLKILSYNVMGFDRSFKENGENPILNYLKESNADIICIQEYSTSNNPKKLTQENIAEALKEYPFFKKNQVGSSSSGNFVACFSKYPILSNEKINNQSAYNGSVKYEIAIKQDTITLINSHLESNKLTKEDKVIYEEILATSQEANQVKEGMIHLINKLSEASTIRATQIDTLTKVIAEAKHLPLIHCGDFNDSPISYPLNTLRKQLNDAFVQSGHGLGISYNQNKFYFRIDHILISKDLKSYQCTVDKSIDSSDHYPIWCYVAKNNK
ncbi:MAG: endonuclease [Bacteroidales bacterium]|nr:endonuclease [Bacteroidales bacterium]